MNAFTSVRPRGPDLEIPAAAPRKTNHSRAPIEGNVQQALDRNGRRTVSLERKTKGGITLEKRPASAATLAKQARAASGGGAE
ncbi:hypothetical protein [Acidovorax sp. K2F]|uniref:hypothetical protein n=1 Tax=Acidovorax sp. K2F TaxID=2978125 RepID=UPI0021B08FA6|nr:hypothetical protein [Acidovorax sp. K2F]MCT6719455.1 hypothetical protein [Acidovorax sp. K2F]